MAFFRTRLLFLTCVVLFGRLERLLQNEYRDNFEAIKLAHMHTKKMTNAAAISLLQTTQHDIGFDQASAMVKRFKRFKKQLLLASRKQLSISVDPPKFPDSLAYNNAAVFRLMKTPGCIGIRCYPAIDEQQQFRLVLVGIDESGNNILPPGKKQNKVSAKATMEDGATGILDEGQASPPYPAPANELGV